MEVVTANHAWVQLIGDLLNEGEHVISAGKRTLELIPYKSTFDMRYPLVTVDSRKLSYRYAFGESWWILNGRDDVASIAQYNKRIAAYSDDGVSFFGAYGPRIAEQMPAVVAELLRDPNSRRAIINIWRPNPPSTKDYPCTMTIQFLIRGGRLHVIDTMRSSDAWLGWPYDTFTFTMVAASLLLRLASRGLHVELGDFHLIAGSQHLYDSDRDKAESCMGELHATAYARFDPHAFKSCDDLEQLLKARADGLKLAALFPELTIPTPP